MERTEVLRYIYTSHCCSHAQQTLSRPQPVPFTAKILARLLIITSRRKVSVLGLVTKSMLKIFIWQQLGELGRAACTELREGTRMTITKGRAARMVMRQGAGLGVSQAIITETNQVHITNYQSKQRLLWANNPLNDLQNKPDLWYPFIMYLGTKSLN